MQAGKKDKKGPEKRSLRQKNEKAEMNLEMVKALTKLVGAAAELMNNASSMIGSFRNSRTNQISYKLKDEESELEESELEESEVEENHPIEDKKQKKGEKRKAKEDSTDTESQVKRTKEDGPPSSELAKEKNLAGLGFLLELRKEEPARQQNSQPNIAPTSFAPPVITLKEEPIHQTNAHPNSFQHNRQGDGHQNAALSENALQIPSSSLVEVREQSRHEEPPSQPHHPPLPNTPAPQSQTSTTSFEQPTTISPPPSLPLQSQTNPPVDTPALQLASPVDVQQNSSPAQQPPQISTDLPSFTVMQPETPREEPQPRTLR
eukprot:TRINITY_DN3077_c0_g1_i1.p1 TRINITY_DN3077_c0_g1~~TRINITY_DN3077_c0_g1_i1.p1  ORF type:complete len:328 (+),score=77.19 TRINITY_DN3077_c0_g1_i1:30-986(+)